MLVAESLRAGYGATEVLHGVDLTLHAHELLAVVGPNGTGKSTLLRCFAGLLRPSAGRVTLDGRDVRSLDRASIARRISVVPQILELLFPFTVREIVGLGRIGRLGLLGVAGGDDRRAVDRAIEELELGALADRPVDTLSGGERQRAVLAMALAQEADVLLLDEPTVHLDPAHQRATLELIRRLARSRGVAAMAVLHDLNLGASLADRIVVLDQGRVVADGPPSRVLSAATVAAVFGPGLVVGAHDGVPFVLPRRPG